MGVFASGHDATTDTFYQGTGINADTSMYGGGDYTPEGIGRRTDIIERDRYRGLGAAAAARQAYQVDFDAAQDDRNQGNAARRGQMVALGMQRNAALGNAPSRAAIMGNQAGGQSLQAALGASAGARPGGFAAAQMAAQGGMGGMQLGAQQQAMGMRSGEMNQARGQFGAGASEMRAGDYTAQGMAQQQAEAQAQSEIAQRHLNQQAQMGYEQMGVNTEQAQLDARMRTAGVANKQKQTADAANDANEERWWKVTKAATSAVSDARAKQGATMLSDAHAKREAYLLGRAHQNEQAATGKPVEFAYGGKPKPGEDIVDKDPSKATEAKREMQTFTREARPEPQPSPAVRAAVQYMDPHGLVPPPPGLSGPAAVQGISAAAMAAARATGAAPPDARANLMATSDERAKQSLRAPVSDDDYKSMTSGPSKWEQEWRRSKGNSSSSGMSDEQDEQNNPQAYDDEMTVALADGLKPYEYEYKPGFAEAEGQQPGEKNVGPMAQDMASNPITGQAVEKRPDGLLQIDMKKATKLSLAAAGHNAQKIRELEARMKGGA